MKPRSIFQKKKKKKKKKNLEILKKKKKKKKNELGYFKKKGKKKKEPEELLKLDPKNFHQFQKKMVSIQEILTLIEFLESIQQRDFHFH